MSAFLLIWLSFYYSMNTTEKNINHEKAINEITINTGKPKLRSNIVKFSFCC